MDNRFDEKIPRSAVKTREGGGRSLSYLEGWYVQDRLNQVLGHGKWSYSISELTKVFEGTTTQRSGEVYTTSYIAQVNLRIESGPGVESAYYEDVGYGDGTDRNNPGKAHELAVKEAVTDGLKRAARNLGMSFGLALYDKSQEFVSDESTIVAKSTPDAELPKAEIKEAAKSLFSSEMAKTKLKNAIKILMAQKLATEDDFKSKVLADGALSKMNEGELKSALGRLKEFYPTIP